ncbi:MAG: Phosphate-import permease protein PhnE, partial [Pseudomonadota bacterium]
MKPISRDAANQPYRLPPPVFSARCTACWFTLGLL